ncbi:hypothetical protein [Methylobacterium indicum]|uniref:Uncharacterized protein n=1 Tax=Methylobacterium indicum TaxID=1775910 RepID=A0A8H8X1H7_9HYPH|nr:hypothetical protein [Methylobacterium indicum]BCM87822.1 hypothetical protein mvi_62830 [Methylobacterium indicum]
MQGFVFYNGPSILDGSPIVGIVTGLIHPSPNQKTGPMAQVYFLVADMPPLQASHAGRDAAICGSCPLRGRLVKSSSGANKVVERQCYVFLPHGPRQVYDAWRKGNYPEVGPRDGSRALTRRLVRLGSYGDPACVPYPVLEALLAKAGDVTGYTHQWQRFPELRRWCMASCDTPAERDAAHALGFRTFRIRRRDEPVLAGEGICPGSHEMNRALRCSECMLCGGESTGTKGDVTIIAHGHGANYFHRNVPETLDA